MIDASDLIERHPELRLELIPSDRIHEHNRSRRLTAFGGYELWRVAAFDRSRTGVIVSFFRGDPFDADYRQRVFDGRAGRAVESASMRPSSYPAVEIVVFSKGQLVAHSHAMAPPGAFAEAATNENPWWIRVATDQFQAEGGGWRLVASGVGRRLGLDGVRRPGPTPDGAIRVELNVQPAFSTTTVQRASAPDSPSGARHDWLLACPSAVVSGEVEFRSALGRVERLRAESWRGSVEHLWGSGPFGEGFRRWRCARLSWSDGAVVSELVILKKFIQIAGTLMIFRPDELPVIARCERPPETDYERGAWLLAFPLSMTWRSIDGVHEITHDRATPGLVRPHRAFGFSRATLESGEPPHEFVLENAPGVFEIIQPARLDWRLWRPWVRSWPRPSEPTPESDGK
ncbi:MAG: hypothetical protein ACF8PN_11490 [Phycisphaerales bacterium]